MGKVLLIITAADHNIIIKTIKVRLKAVTVTEILARNNCGSGCQTRWTYGTGLGKL